MQKFLVSAVLCVIVLLAFVLPVSAQTPNMPYVGQVGDGDGLPIQGAYGALYGVNSNGDEQYIAGTYSDGYGNLWLSSYGDEQIGDGSYTLKVSAQDFLMNPVKIVIQGGNITNLNNEPITLRPAMKDTSLLFRYNLKSRLVEWTFAVRGYAAYSPVLRIETLISSPAKTMERVQFAVRQGQDYFGSSYDSYENTTALDSLSNLSADEQEAWRPEYAGLEAPKPQGLSYYSQYANSIKLPKSLPVGSQVCGFITVYRTGDPTNVRSNRHGFCVRLEDSGFTGTPTIYTW